MEFLYLPFIVLRANRVSAENIIRTLDQAFLPFLDLVRVDIKLLGQISQRALAFQGRHRHLCFERWAMVPSFPLRQRIADSGTIIFSSSICRLY